MKTLKNLIFGLLTLVSLSGAGQNPFSFDTSQKKIVLPIANAIDYGNKKVYTEEDSLGRNIYEIDWYDGLREEIKIKYKGESDTLIYKQKILYNDSTGLKKSIKETKIIYLEDTLNSLNTIEKKFDNKEKIISTKKYSGIYCSKGPLELIQQADSNGDGQFEKFRKIIFAYKKDGTIIRNEYKKNKKGKLELKYSFPVNKHH